MLDKVVHAIIKEILSPISSFEENTERLFPKKNKMSRGKRKREMDENKGGNVYFVPD